MKVTFEFDRYEDQELLQIYQSAEQMHSVLWELTQYLRSQLKHREHSEEVEQAYEQVQQRLYDLIADNNIDL